MTTTLKPASSVIDADNQVTPQERGAAWLLKTSMLTNGDKEHPPLRLSIHGTDRDDGTKFGRAAKVALTSLLLIGTAMISASGYANDQLPDYHNLEQNLLATANADVSFLVPHLNPSFIYELNQQAPETVRSLERFNEARLILAESPLPSNVYGPLASCFERKMIAMGMNKDEMATESAALVISTFTVDGMEQIKHTAEREGYSLDIAIGAFCVNPGEWTAQAAKWRNETSAMPAAIGQIIQGQLGSEAIETSLSQSNTVVHAAREAALIENPVLAEAVRQAQLADAAAGRLAFNDGNDRLTGDPDAKKVFDLSIVSSIASGASSLANGAASLTGDRTVQGVVSSAGNTTQSVAGYARSLASAASSVASGNYASAASTVGSVASSAGNQISRLTGPSSSQQYGAIVPLTRPTAQQTTQNSTIVPLSGSVGSRPRGS